MTLLRPNQSGFYMELKRVFALQSDFVSYRMTQFRPYWRRSLALGYNLA